MTETKTLTRGRAQAISFMMGRSLGWFAIALLPLVGVGAWMGCGNSGDAALAQADASSQDGGDEASSGDNGGEEDEPSDDSLGDDGSAPPPIPGDGGDAGTPIPSPIRYVLVIVKENHTFDNYFTGFPGADTSMTAKLSDGTTYTRPAAPNKVLPSDICHVNCCGIDAYDNGKMDGFDRKSSSECPHGGAGLLPFIRYTEQQIPNYWQYARNFVLADHFFSTTLTQSAPGHEVFWVGHSLTIDNPKCATPDGGGCTGYGCVGLPAMSATAITNPKTCATATAPPCFDVPSLPDHLPAGFTWMDYGGAVATMVKSITNDPSYKSHFRSASSLVGDLQTGHLANLTIAHLSGGNTSEHPDQFPCDGENFSVKIISAAMQLPQWNEMAILVTWDDWGGFYDHVKPTVHTCANGKVFNTGFRLPLIVMSPYAKTGYVLKTPTEQASVPRLVEDLWGMTYMSAKDPNARDGTAGSLMGAFDFTQAPRSPMILTPHSCPDAGTP
jgi:phospholipase C